MKTGLIPHKRTDKLRAVFFDPATGKLFVQPKRVAASCRLTKEEIHLYAHGYATEAVKRVMARLEMSLAEAWNLIKQEAGR